MLTSERDWQQSAKETMNENNSQQADIWIISPWQKHPLRVNRLNMFETHTSFLSLVNKNKVTVHRHKNHNSPLSHADSGSNHPYGYNRYHMMFEWSLTLLSTP